MTQISGTPGVSAKIEDVSAISAGSVSGIIAVLGYTERGVPFKKKLVTSWAEFVREFGGLSKLDDFPLYCKHALERGAKLYVVRVVPCTVVGAVVTFLDVKATGTITSTTKSAVFDAVGVGVGYNGSTITVTASKSGVAGNVDIAVNLKGSDKTSVISNVAAVQNADGISALNLQLEEAGVKLKTVTEEIPVGSVVLAGGTTDLSEFTDADFAGDSAAKTGIYAFDDVTDCMRIFNFNRPSVTVDGAIAAYCQGRGDMRARLRVPIGLSDEGIASYINGEGSVNSLYAEYCYTDIEIIDPFNSKAKKTVSGIGFLAGNRATVDVDYGPWFSDAGNRGRMSGILGVSKNYIAPGNKGQFDSLYESGLNAIVVDDALGICYWGNRTSHADKTQLTSKTNIADLSIFSSRELTKIGKPYMFEPNDVAMFRKFYQSAKTFIKNTLISGRAIEGNSSSDAGENSLWHWVGDQNVESIAEVAFNNPADVDAGIYKVQFVFKPKGATEYISLTISPADSTTIATLNFNG